MAVEQVTCSFLVGKILGEISRVYPLMVETPSGARLKDTEKFPPTEKIVGGRLAESEGERVLALESREGTRASRRVEEGISRSFSGERRETLMSLAFCRGP